MCFLRFSDQGGFDRRLPSRTFQETLHYNFQIMARTETQNPHAHTDLRSLFHVLHLTLHVVLLSSEKLDFIQQFAEVLLANFGLFTLHNGYLR